MRGEKLSNKFIVFGIIFVFLIGLVSAGVGISWDKESSLVPEKTKTCLTYKVYNPWPDDAYAKVELSEELQEIIKSEETEIKFIPAETSSADAIPVSFCFKTPNIYERDCWIGNSFICKQDCNEEMKVYSGEVLVMEVSEDEFISGGAGGSRTMMSISAPLKIRVQCVAHDRNYSLIYVVVALIAGILLILNVLKQRKKGKGKKKEDKEEKVEEKDKGKKKKSSIEEEEVVEKKGKKKK